MQPILFRQLKDIQLQAERLITGNPEEEELENFSRYNLELREYVRSHTEDPEILQLLDEIPDVLEVDSESNNKPGHLLIIFTILTLGISALYLSYAANLRRVRLIQNAIQTVRGKYASIEFLLKAKG